MKSIYLTLAVTIILLSGCDQKEEVNQFTSEQDTLVLTTVKQMGNGLFSSGAGSLYFQDTTERYLYPIVFPNDIDEIRLALRFIDLKVWQFNRYKKGESELKYLLDDIANGDLDTLNCPTTEQNYINIMTGYKDSVSVFIVDENNNKDFRDDSVRVYQELNWRSTENLIKFTYEIFDGQSIVKDSSWINIGTLGGSDLWSYISQYFTADLSIDDQSYQIGISDEQSGFTYDLAPRIALLSENGISKDTLLKSEVMYLDEYIKLGNTYYRFDRITNSGKYVTLIKENDFEDLEGTQVGMLAPGFTFKSYAGDTIHSTALHDKPLLIANISGCTSRSFSVYTEMSKRYADKLFVLGLTPHITEDFGGTLADTEDPVNKGIYDIYRHAYSSYTCYLIGTNNRIIDKFDVFKWEAHLSKYFGEDE